MKADWTPTGGALVTLADDNAKVALTIEQLGGQIAEQVEELAFGANVFRKGRGNLNGECVFTAAKSHATRAAAVAYAKAEYARMGASGSLVLTEAATTLTMAGAVLRGVVVTKFEGLRWTIRYTFGITTVT